MDKTGRGFQYVRCKFPNVNDGKIKEGIFIGPQIRELMQGI
jgi:translation elongation factor P/translation initiation factor 5A